MTQITISQPTRNEMRAVFELAISGARTDAGREMVLAAARYHELLWKAQDQTAAAAKEQEAQEAQRKVDKRQPKPKSAVEEFGINSPEAQAKRDARAAKRLKDEAQAKRDARAAKRLKDEAARQRGKAGKKPPDADTAVLEPTA